MTRKKLIPVYRRSEIPHFSTDAEFAAFWDTHEITEELIADARAHGWVPERPLDRLARIRAARKQQTQSAEH